MSVKEAKKIETAFLSGGGEMGAQIARFDWSKTALGPLETWPHSLRISAGLLVRSPMAMVLLWGKEGVMLYNDAYCGMANGEHPLRLGARGRESWPELADYNDSVLREELAAGTLSHTDREWTVSRNGRAEQAWINLYCSPVLDENGRPAGVMARLVETTKRVLAERRLTAERERLATMFEQAPGFVCMQHGPDHVFEFANDALREWAGGRPLIGLTVREAWPELAGQGFYELLDEVYATGRPYRARRALVRRAVGTTGEMEDRFVDFIYQPVFGADGKVSGIFTQGYDVTEQARAEKAVREHQEQLETLTDALPGLAFMNDRSGGNVFVNQQCTAFTGCPAEALLGWSWLSVLHPEDVEHVSSTWKRAVASGEDCETECRVRRRDGCYRWFLFRSRPVRSGAKIVRWVGLAIDIHEWKETQAALKASEKRFRDLFNTMTEGFFTADLIRGPDGRVSDCRFIEVAPSSLALTGVAADETIGRTMTEVFGRAHPIWLEAYERAVTEGRFRFEGYSDRLDRWYAASFYRCGDDRISGVYTEITASRKAQEQLRRERAKFETALDHLPVGVWYLNQDGSVAYGNPQAKTIWASERSRERRDCKGWWRDSGRPIAAHEWGCVRALRKAEASLNEEIDIQAFDGTRKAILSSAFPVLDADGAAVGAIVVNQDISARAAMEDALREAKSEADRANLAKSKFLATASHDLRQPVQSLVLLLATLQRRAVPSELEPPIAFMGQAVEALRTMLDGLLDLSRLDAGIVPPQLAPIDAGAMIRRLGLEYAVRAGERGLGLHVFDQSAAVQADAEYLERALRNLIENALRYTERGGVEIMSRCCGAEVRIDVIDSGIGIAAEDQQTVFDEFVQVDNDARDRAKGLGLGLAIVRRLVGLMGGQIELQSCLGHGSRFTLILPAASPVVVEAAAATAGISARGLSALVIDDDEIVRASLCMMLESWGFDVVAAASGRDAIERLGTLPDSPAVILADYRLRGETGLTAVQGVFDRLGRPVPTAIITGDTDVERIKEVQDSGFLMLHKPIGADAIEQALTQLLPA